MEERKNNKGFTLVEVIVASLILIVAILPIASSFVVSDRMNVKGRIKEQAMTVAQNTVESVKGLGAKTCYELASKNSVGIIGTGTMKLTEDNTAKTDANKCTKDIEVDGVKKTAVWHTYEYKFSLTGVLMGQSYYDANVTVRLDADPATADDVNILAYAYESNYKEFDLSVMEYYVVDVEVYKQDTTEKLAEYSGTFVTKN